MESEGGGECGEKRKRKKRTEKVRKKKERVNERQTRRNSEKIVVQFSPHQDLSHIEL
jgi:hypothetical protein